MHIWFLNCTAIPYWKQKLVNAAIAHSLSYMANADAIILEPSGNYFLEVPVYQYASPTLKVFCSFQIIALKPSDTQVSQGHI